MPSNLRRNRAWQVREVDGNLLHRCGFAFADTRKTLPLRRSNDCPAMRIWPLTPSFVLHAYSIDLSPMVSRMSSIHQAPFDAARTGAGESSMSLVDHYQKGTLVESEDRYSVRVLFSCLIQPEGHPLVFNLRSVSTAGEEQTGGQRCERSEAKQCASHQMYPPGFPATGHVLSAVCPCRLKRFYRRRRANAEAGCPPLSSVAEHFSAAILALRRCSEMLSCPQNNHLGR